MTEDTHYKTPMLWADDVFVIQSALLIAIDYYNCEGMYGYAEKCSEQIKHLLKSEWKESQPNHISK